MLQLELAANSSPILNKFFYSHFTGKKKRLLWLSVNVSNKGVKVRKVKLHKLLRSRMRLFILKETDAGMRHGRFPAVLIAMVVNVEWLASESEVRIIVSSNE
jgi:hypothetical protein